MLLLPALIGFSNMEAQKTATPQKPGISLTSMDTSVKPGDDFFRFVNGKWLEKTEIPADKTRWGSFDELRQNTDKDALAILKEALHNPKYKSNTYQGKAINLYTSILDTVGRNKQGIKPIQVYLSKIEAIKNVTDLQVFLSEAERNGGMGFYGIGIDADDKDSNKNVVSLNVGRLGLPDKDYYVAEDKDSKEKREKYVLHVAKMLQFLGDSPEKAKSLAERVLAFEIELSKPRFDRVERRDSRKSYNPMTVAELQKMTPAINWERYFQAVGLPKLETIIVTQPRYFTALQTILAQNKIEDWKAYLKWTLLNKTSNKLTTEIESANFDFYGKTLTGAIKQRPREERALQTVNSEIGEALGKLYVEKKFPAEAKAKAESMIKNIIKAYHARIDKLTWMSAATKLSAHTKLDKMTIKVGYPDKWKDYSKLAIKSPQEGGSYLENAMNLAQWQHQESLEKLSKPVDKTEWGMSPQTVNAYFNPSYNEIVFPAAILQPPFYNYQADEAVNYGGIGAVIGHEISHGFDDSGARYNAEGNLVDWWTEDDLNKFTALGTALSAQYSALEPLPGIFVDGKFTLGENIGDLGGVNAAYDGLQLYLKEHGNPGLIDGYTPNQRFFISWGTIWRSKMRDEAMKNQVKTDPHAPAKYRSYVPIQNMDAFYETFSIAPTDKLFIKPESRVKIW